MIFGVIGIISFQDKRIVYLFTLTKLHTYGREEDLRYINKLAAVSGLFTLPILVVQVKIAGIGEETGAVSDN